jgi:SAM-dependent methyltransferase
MEFVVDDPLEMSRVGRTFDTVIDSGLFHTFSLDTQPGYVATLARLVRPAGRLFILCFSDNQPGRWGPRRITQAEIRSAFCDGWTVREIRPAGFEANTEHARAQAWLAVVERS